MREWRWPPIVSLKYSIITFKERNVVEEEVEAWIVEFKKEIDRIETFFKKNLRELKAEFKKLEK